MTQQTIFGLYLLQAAASGFARRFLKSHALIELTPDLKRKKRENSGARTHDIQSHNLALYH